MTDLEKAPAILERALAEWRKQQTLKKGKTSVTHFADYLEYSQSAVSFWLNGTRPISEDAIIAILPKLIELLGEDICNELQVPKPDMLYGYVIENWKDTPPEERSRIAKIVEKYSKKPIPTNGTKTKPAPKS